MIGDPVVVGGRYELGELLGRGGMAEVRSAIDNRLGRPVAVAITPGQAHDLAPAEALREAGAHPGDHGPLARSGQGRCHVGAPLEVDGGSRRLRSILRGAGRRHLGERPETASGFPDRVVWSGGRVNVLEGWGRPL